MLVTHCMTRSAHKYKCAYHTANSSQWLSQNLSKSNIALNTSVGNQRLLSSVTSQYKASCKSQLKLPNPQCRIREYITPKTVWQISTRLAGHAKWQNIAATKGANDKKFSRICQRHANNIVVAIKSNNNETNPKHNPTLAKAIADAQYEDVPKATIENAIKRSKNADAALVESILEVRGPGNTFIIIQSLAKSKTIAYQSVQSVLRKAKAGVIDQKLVNLFDKRGIIWAKACRGLTLDMAEEDAIECGAEEIEEADISADENNRVFQFLCNPIDVSVVKNNLAKKTFDGLTSYEIMSADIEYLPTGEYIDLDSAKEEEAFKKLISLLNDNEFVTGVYHNCSLEMSN